MGVGLILSQCRAETSAASPHSHLCQLEMSLEWHKESNAVFCEVEQTGWVSLPVFPSPDHWSLVFLQMLSHPLNLLILVDLSFSLRKMTSCNITNCPVSYSVIVAVSFGKEHKTVLGQNPNAQNTIMLIRKCRNSLDSSNLKKVQLPQMLSVGFIDEFFRVYFHIAN